MPKPFPKEFRDDVIRVAGNRDPEVTLAQIVSVSGSSAGKMMYPLVSELAVNGIPVVLGIEARSPAVLPLVAQPRHEAGVGGGVSRERAV